VFQETGAANDDDAVWDLFTTSLNSFAGQTVYLRITAADASTASYVEAGVDDVRIEAVGGGPTPTPPPTNTPPPGGNLFFDNFETNQGWTVNPNGTDTATLGQWQRANPEQTTYNGATYQQGTTVSGSNDLVTGSLAGSAVGSYDVDGGVTSIRSPNISLPSSGNITLSFYYYLAHLDNSSSADFLRVSVVGNTTSVVLQELGAANNDAAVWASFSTSLNSFAGQTIYLRVEVSDTSTASLIEAAIDDVSIDFTP
jgi:aminopeptidase S